MLGKAWVGVAFLLVLVALAPSARSQASRKAAAEQLFQTGKELIARGELERACQAFEGSQRMDPALGTMLHLADCYERAGQNASAWAMFEEAASLAQVSGQTQREQVARTRAKALEPRLSRMELRVPAEARVPGLQLWVSGVSVPAASWGVAFPIDPGRQVVRAEAPDHEVWSRTIDVSGSSPVLEVVVVGRLTPLPARPAPTVAPQRPPVPSRRALEPSRSREPDSSSTQRTWGVVTGAIGLAAIMTGAALGVVALVSNNESLDECRPEDPTRCTSRGVELRRRAEDFALGSTITLVAGGVVLATGVTLVLAAPRAEGGDAAPSSGPSAAAISLGGHW
jgi:hypothetical protein